MFILFFRKLWYFMESVVKATKTLTDFVKDNKIKFTELINSSSPKG